MGEMIKNSLYYAKILLFGEYGIIEDSMGLSIPYHFFKGNFDFATNPNEVQANSNRSIREFTSHLESLSQSGKLPDRKSTRLNSSHIPLSRMPSSA